MKSSFETHGRLISIRVVDDEDYLSLTDLAKHKGDDGNEIIRNWIRLRDTVAFLGLWESLNNPDFDQVGFEEVTSGAGLNSYTLSPTKWIDAVRAKGIVSVRGRNGGTFAHSDIAFEFASWLSPEFKLFVIRDYKRLKKEESERQSLDWNLSRQLSKVNYRIHTDSIKENLIPSNLTKTQARFVYADEADMLNVVVFGVTAKEWRDGNPEQAGNIRDHASINQLLVLMNLENQNATLVRDGVSQAQRMQMLRDTATSQLRSFESMNAGNKLKMIQNNS